jgi:hypothetical protein
MNRNYSRVAALVFFLYLVVSPAVMAMPRRDRDAFAAPSERIVRIVKKIKNVFRGFTSQEDTQVPPVPKP